METENFLDVIIKNFPPETILRKLGKKNVDRICINVTIPANFPVTDLNATVSGVNYIIKTDLHSISTVEFSVGKIDPNFCIEEYIYPEIHTTSTLRLLGLRWRISTVSKRLRRLEDILFGEKFSQVNKKFCEHKK